MNDMKNQNTLFSLLELLFPKKEENGEYSRKYEDISVIDDIVSKLPVTYENSEEEIPVIHFLLNYRIKQLYCDFNKYKEANNFNKSFTAKLIPYFGGDFIPDYAVPYFIYEAFAQLNQKNYIDDEIFSMLDKVFSSDISNRIVFAMPIHSFQINDKFFSVDLYPEEFFAVYIYYLKEIKKKYNTQHIEDKICFFSGKVLECLTEFSIDVVKGIYDEFKYLLAEMDMPKDANKKYLILFAKYYFDIEFTKIIHSKKYDEEEGAFKKLNKNELKMLRDIVNKFTCHILSMPENFIDKSSNYYTAVSTAIECFSIYSSGKNLFVESFCENLKKYNPIKNVLDWIVGGNIEVFFELKEYSSIAGYYIRNKNIIKYFYYSFEIAYSLYECKYYTEAKFVYESVNENEKSSSICNNLALIYEQEGDFHKAHELLSTSIEIDSSNETAKRNFARIKDKITKEQKVKQINDVYSKKMPSVEFEILPFRTKVYLGAICRELLSENLHEIMPQIEAQNPITPTDKFLKIVYNDLTNNKVITVSTRSSIEAFSEEKDDIFPNTYYTCKVMYNLNLLLPTEKQDLIYQILNPQYYSNCFSEEVYTLWKEIAVEECIEYLLYQLETVGFCDFSPGDKTYIAFNTLLENFSVGQIYGIIYKSVANASKLYLEKSMPKNQAANSVIGGCQRLGENAVLNGWDMSQYSRIKQLPQSVLSEFFFNKVIGIGNKGFTMPPTSEIDAIS